MSGLWLIFSPQLVHISTDITTCCNEKEFSILFAIVTFPRWRHHRLDHLEDYDAPLLVSPLSLRHPPPTTKPKWLLKMSIRLYYSIA